MSFWVKYRTINIQVKSMFSKYLSSPSTINSTCRFFSNTAKTHRLASIIHKMGSGIRWEKTNCMEYPYKTTISGEKISLRFNSEWPDKALYTALDKNNNEIIDIDDIKERAGKSMILNPIK